MQNDYLIIGNCFIYEIIEKELHKSKVILNMEISKNLKIYNDITVLEASKAKFENYKWIFYDKNGNNINIENFRIAVTGDFDIKPVKYQNEKYEDSDEKTIRKLDENISEKDKTLYSSRLKKIIFDFDYDGIAEKLCTTSNFLFGEKNKKNYMYLEKNGTIVDKITDFDANLFHIIEVLKINGSIYIIVLKSLGDPISYKDKNLFIYRILNNKIVECKIDLLHY